MKQVKQILSICLVLAVAVSFIFPNFVLSENQESRVSAINYLKTQSQTPWSVMALATAGENNIDSSILKSVPDNQKSLMNYSKYVLAIASLGKDPATFGNENYIAKIKSYFSNNQFGETNLINDDVWAIIALGSLGQDYSTEVQKSKDFIISHQNQDGGWGYSTEATSDTNDTASAIMALLEAGVSKNSQAIQGAVEYLKSSQNSDGGFGYENGGASDSCSNAWVISAIYKIKENPKDNYWIKNDKNAFDSLLSLQDVDGGFFWQALGDNKMCSAFATLAINEGFYPVFTNFNLHTLKIENQENNVCDASENGLTPLELVINGSSKCGYSFDIQEYPGIGSYLSKINNIESWMYKVNEEEPLVGAGEYYLKTGDSVLWYVSNWQETTSTTPTSSDAKSKTASLKVEIDDTDAEPGDDSEAISFSVDVLQFDFGKMKPGQNKEINFSIKNEGIPVEISTEVSGSDLFKNNLTIASKTWQTFIDALAKGEQKQYSAGLFVPAGFQNSQAIQNGEITFWAQKTN